jgi:hypothetical protein
MPGANLEFFFFCVVVEIGAIQFMFDFKKDERCRRTPGWKEVPFAIYYVLNNRHNEIN